MMSGPHDVGVKQGGPYAYPEMMPNAWFYRKTDGSINLEIQVAGIHGMMHYSITIPAKRNANRVKQVRGKR